jgi:NAD(P)-dependent dehydrogenase (short-subunit alcohol dehydrogenase family)
LNKVLSDGKEGPIKFHLAKGNFTKNGKDIAIADAVYEKLVGSKVWGLLSGVKKEAMKIDILICNAGYAPANYLVTMTPGNILERVMKTNILGTFFIFRIIYTTLIINKVPKKFKFCIIHFNSLISGMDAAAPLRCTAIPAALVASRMVSSTELPLQRPARK